MSSLRESAWPDLEAARLLVVPVGATEQHGPHLPLTTDTEIAETIARRLVADLPGVVLAPAVAYGASGEHQAFAGTLSIGRDATALLLVELARSATETFPRVLYLCAHGGNAEPLSEAIARLRGEDRDVRAWMPRWPGDAHAGQVETSLMLAIAPERVDLGRARAGNPAPIGELMPTLRSDGVRAASPNGVLGDPTTASAERGYALLNDEHDSITRMVREWL